jgi:hypothetical protein
MNVKTLHVNTKKCSYYPATETISTCASDILTSTTFPPAILLESHKTGKTVRCERREFKWDSEGDCVSAVYTPIGTVWQGFKHLLVYND